MFQLPPGMNYQQFVAAGMPGYQSDTPGPGGFGRDVFTPPAFDPGMGGFGSDVFTPPAYDPGMGGVGGNSAGGFAPGLMPPLQPGKPGQAGGQPYFGPSPSQGSPWGGSPWGGQFGGFNPFGGGGSFGGNQFGGQPWGDALPPGGRTPMAGSAPPPTGVPQQAAPVSSFRPGQAQPIQPPAQGTPYGSQPSVGIGQRGGFGKPPAPQRRAVPNLRVGGAMR